MNSNNQNTSTYLDEKEQAILNSPNLNQTFSYQEKYKELYGNNQQQGYNQMGNYQQSNPYVDATQIQGVNPQLMNLNLMNAASYTNIAPSQNVVVDNVANLQYVKNGYNNVSLNSSQYGLCDLDASDWFKFNLLLLVPIFNTLYYFYYAFLKAFIKFPILKEFSKSAIITSIAINVLYIIAIFMLI